MTEEPLNRYQKSKKLRVSKERHTAIVERLAYEDMMAFDLALEEYRPPCVMDPTTSYSPWTDWSSEVTGDEYGDAEIGETPAPSAQAARLMCAGCDVLELCDKWARAGNLYHGVAGGQRYEKGRQL